MPTHCPACRKPLTPGVRFCTDCGAFVETPPPLPDRPLHELLMDALGEGYELMGELGRGGFAIVYSVRDRSTEGYLAIKVVRPEFLHSEVILERFRREVTYVMRLNHPNVLSIAFAADRGDLAYYAMPRIPGEPLNKLLGRFGPLPLSRTVRIARGIAAGLQYAHEKEIIHRDIKPSNILVTEDDDARILDFGIAKAMSPDGTTISYSGEIIGTVEYMSPEQADGAKHITHKADIYSWAVVTFEMLAGRPPLTGKSMREVMHHQIWTEPPDVRTFRPDTPTHLAELVHKCLAKNPAMRAYDMREIIRVLGTEDGGRRT